MVSTSTPTTEALPSSMTVSPTFNFRQKSHLRQPFTKKSKISQQQRSKSFSTTSVLGKKASLYTTTTIPDVITREESVFEKAGEISSACFVNTVYIKRLMRSIEIQQKYLPSPNYLKKVQDDSITEGMRKTTLVGVAKINAHLKYHPETFGIAVNLFDRCLSKIQVREVHLQLIAATCFLIASKIGEKWLTHPRFKELCIAGDHRFSCSDIKRMESLLIKKLNWQLNPPTTYLFVELVLSCFQLKSEDNTILLTSKQDRASLLEIAYRLCSTSALSYRFLIYKPSTIACCAVAIAIKHILAQRNMLNDINLESKLMMPMCELTHTKQAHAAQCFDDLMKISAFM